MRLRFEDCELDPREARLVRAGRVIELQPKHFQALVFFAERAGRLIPHDELMEGLWPDVHVNEEALQQVVSKLRKALGDSAREPRFLQTVPKRGYRFLPEVAVVPDPEPAKGADDGAPPPAPIANLPPPAPSAGAAPDIESPPPAPAPRAAPEAPSRRARPRRLLAVLAAAAAAVAAAAATARRPPPPAVPHPGSTRSLTHSLERKQDGTFTPDGQAVIFAANDVDEGQYDLHLVGLAEGSERRRLTHTPGDEFSPQVSPDGATVLFSRADDAEPAAFTMPIGGGPARQITARAAYATFSPDGREIAFLRAEPRGGHAIIARDLRSGVERAVARVPGEAQSLAWSPDGASLAYSDDTRAWRVPAAGGEPRPVGPPAQQLRSLAWDPSGLALLGDPNWSGRSNLWWIPLSGAPVALTSSAGGVHHPAVAPGGGRALYVVEAKHQMIRRVRARGEAEPIPAPASIDCVDVDREERWLSGTDWEGGLEDRMSLVDLRSGAAHGLGVGRCPRVSPDGRLAAFLQASRLWVLDLATRERRPLGPIEDEAVTAPAWSPDGGEVALVMRRAGREDLMVTVLASGARRALGTSHLGPLTYAPDGGRLAVGTKDGVFLVDARTGAAQKLTDLHSFENAPAWAEDGRSVRVLVGERRRPAMVTVRLDGTEAGRVALPVLADPGFWGVFTVRPLRDGGFVMVQSRYQADLYLLEIQR